MTVLRQRMLDDMRIRNLAAETQTSYVRQVAKFARYHGQSPELLGPEDIRTYQLHLIDERQLAPTSVAGTVAALRFLYQVTLQRDWAVEALPLPKRGETLPDILSPEEVVRFLAGVARPKHRMILTTCYAAGLRLSEALRLQVTDVDSNRMVLHVAQGKGARDRYVMLSPTLLQQLRVWWRVERPAGGRHPQVAGGGLQTPMPEQELDGAQVGAGLEEMHREGMAKRMRRDDLGETRAPGGDPAGQPNRAARDRRLGRSPGKSQCRGRSTLHQARSTASSFGESIT